MQIKVNYQYTKYVTPPRCRKPRPQTCYDSIVTDVREMTDESFPIAFIVHDLVSPENETVIRMDAETKQLYWLDEYCTVQNLIDNIYPNLYGSYTQPEALEVIDKFYSDLVIYGNALWTKTAEPVYVIRTYGLRRDRGETGIVIEDVSAYPSVDANMNVFRADETDLVIQQGVKTARERGNTDSIPKLEGLKQRQYIEVLRPDAITVPTFFERQINYFRTEIQSVLTDMPDEITDYLVHTLWPRREELRSLSELKAALKTCFTDMLLENISRKPDPLSSLAEYMVNDGTEHTSSGNWIFYADEIAEKYGIIVRKDNEAGKKLLDYLTKYPQVADVEVSDECVDICFYTDYCHNLEENDPYSNSDDGPAEAPVTLESVADQMIRSGIDNTNSGGWTFYYDELDEMFGINSENDATVRDKLRDILSNREEVAEVEFTDEAVDISFYTDFLPGGPVEKGIKSAVYEQECEACGTRFKVKYLEDGSFEYVDEPCGCEAPFTPVEGSPSLSQWLYSLRDTE